jgi:hypothetical protein
VSGLDDYMSGMSELTDHDIERLLTGSTMSSAELADLERFVAALAGDANRSVDSDFMATSLAAVARQSRRSGKGTIKRLAVLMASMALLFAFSGIALATVADGVSPGDVLYGVDRAFERLGIGDGGVDERISEFDSLVCEGAEDDAFVFLATYVESADQRDAFMAAEHLVMAATDESSAANAARKVAELLAFIAANKGDGIGIDGSEFGQGVAQIAKSRPSVDEPTSQPPPKKDPEPTGPPTTTISPRDTTPTAPVDPANRGQGQPEDPGPPEDAGQPPENSPEDDAAGGENGPSENSNMGNSDSKTPLPEVDDGGEQGKANAGGRQGGD